MRKNDADFNGIIDFYEFGLMYDQLVALPYAAYSSSVRCMYACIYVYIYSCGGQEDTRPHSNVFLTVPCELLLVKRAFFFRPPCEADNTVRELTDSTLPCGVHHSSSTPPLASKDRAIRRVSALLLDTVSESLLGEFQKCLWGGSC